MDQQQLQEMLTHYLNTIASCIDNPALKDEVFKARDRLNKFLDMIEDVRYADDVRKEIGELFTLIEEEDHAW